MTSNGRGLRLCNEAVSVVPRVVLSLRFGAFCVHVLLDVVDESRDRSSACNDCRTGDGAPLNKNTSSYRTRTEQAPDTDARRAVLYWTLQPSSKGDIVVVILADWSAHSDDAKGVRLTVSRM